MVEFTLAFSGGLGRGVVNQRQGAILVNAVEHQIEIDWGVPEEGDGHGGRGDTNGR